MEKAFSYPAIIKPRYGSGSRDIFWLKDPEETRQVLAKLKLNDRCTGAVATEVERVKTEAIKEVATEAAEEYILEEAVAGTEYGVDGVMDGDRFQLILLRRKLLTPPPARQAVGYLSVLPLEEAELIERVSDHLGRVTTALGCQDCLLHADLMIRENQVFVIELSARPSGHNLHNCFTPLASGIDMAAEYIKCRIGQRYEYRPTQIRRMMIRYFDLVGQSVSVPSSEQVVELLTKYSPTGRVQLVDWNCQIMPGDCLEAVTTGHSLMGRGYFILEEKSVGDLVVNSEATNSDERLQRCGEEILALFKVI
jgi:biotin carboxylase